MGIKNLKRGFCVVAMVKKLIFIFIFSLIGFVVGGKIMERQIRAAARVAHGEKLPVARQRAPIWDNQVVIDARSHVPQEKRKAYLALLAELLKGNSPDDWERALGVLMANTTGVERWNALRVFFSKWAEKDFNEAWDRSGRMGRFTQEVRREILSQWAERDPQAALLFYESNRDVATQYFFVIRDIVFCWAQQAPEEAWNWILEATKEEKRKNSMAGIFEEFITALEFEKVKTTSYINQFIAEAGYEEISTNLIQKWAEKDPESVWDWVKDTNPPFFIRDKALTGIAKTDLDKATRLIAENIGEPEKRFALFADISSSYLQDDKEKALSWVMDIVPLSHIGEKHLSPLVNYAETSPAEAIKWVRTLPDSPAKEEAVNLYARSIPNSLYYDHAIDLIKELGDFSKQETIMRDVFEHWESVNPDGFILWKEKHNNAEFTQEAEQKHREDQGDAR